MRARQLRGALALGTTFMYDVVSASVAVARIVVSPRGRSAPALVRVPVDARTRWGVALFAYLVSLTPGSTCLAVADDLSSLYVHFLDAPDPDARAMDMKRLYERWIVEMEGTEGEDGVA